jgi:hypothetical protein
MYYVPGGVLQLRPPLCIPSITFSLDHWTCSFSFFLPGQRGGGEVLEKKGRGPSHAWRGWGPWFPDAVKPLRFSAEAGLAKGEGITAFVVDL